MKDDGGRTVEYRKFPWKEVFIMNWNLCGINWAGRRNINNFQVTRLLSRRKKSFRFQTEFNKNGVNRLGGSWFWVLYWLYQAMVVDGSSAQADMLQQGYLSTISLARKVIFSYNFKVRVNLIRLGNGQWISEKFNLSLGNNKKVAEFNYRNKRTSQGFKLVLIYIIRILSS